MVVCSLSRALFKLCALAAEQLLQLVEHFPDQLIRPAYGPARLVDEIAFQLSPPAVIALCSVGRDQGGALFGGAVGGCLGSSVVGVRLGGVRLSTSAGLLFARPFQPLLALAGSAQSLGRAVGGFFGLRVVGRAAVGCVGAHALVSRSVMLSLSCSRADISRLYAVPSWSSRTSSASVASPSPASRALTSAR